MGWIATLASPTNPTAQITIFSANGAPDEPGMTIEVDDVAAIHSAAIEQSYEIVYSLRDEDWGVRRFFIRDPDGVVINVLSHIR